MQLHKSESIKKKISLYILKNLEAFVLDTSRLTHFTEDGMTVAFSTFTMFLRTLFTFLWTSKACSSLTKCQVKTCHFAVTCLPLIKRLPLMGCFTVGSCKRSFPVVLLTHYRCHPKFSSLVSPGIAKRAIGSRLRRWKQHLGRRHKHKLLLALLENVDFYFTAVFKSQYNWSVIVLSMMYSSTDKIIVL